MEDYPHQELFLKFQSYLDNEQETREQIRNIVKEIEQHAKQAVIHLQVIHAKIEKIPQACIEARKCFEECRKGYEQLAALIPPKQYYRYSDQWLFTTHRLVLLISLTVYLESGQLVSREQAADILGLKTNQTDGFHLDVEDYLMGILHLASELSRFAKNLVTLGDYNRPLSISQFVGDLNSGFRLLNLKNDSLRKRFDGLKYDVKKIEEVIYDISIRGLIPKPQASETSHQTNETEPDAQTTSA